MNWFQLINLVIDLTFFVSAFELSNNDLQNSNDDLIPVSRLKEIAQYVNSLDTTWEAKLSESWIVGDNKFLDLNHLTGSVDPSLEDRNELRINKGDDTDDSSDESSEEKANQCVDNGLPKNFDAREHWPKCKSTIGHIYDQGNCGSCWAAAAVAAFTDRLCIQSNGKYTELRSIQQVLSCCHKGVSKDGCNGGSSIAAFDYIRRNGLSTGGDYDSKKGCQPYRLKPCAHHMNSTKLKLCETYPMETAHKCKLHCYNENYSTAFKKDRIKVKTLYYVDPCAVMNELYRRGPVIASFAVFEDFFLYQKGVYQYTTGKERGWHAVRIIGWGEEKGTPYWLVTNSWNDQWGDKGYFKIIRDSPGNCFFQEQVKACTVAL